MVWTERGAPRRLARKLQHTRVLSSLNASTCVAFLSVSVEQSWTLQIVEFPEGAQLFFATFLINQFFIPWVLEKQWESYRGIF